MKVLEERRAEGRAAGRGHARSEVKDILGLWRRRAEEGKRAERKSERDLNFLESGPFAGQTIGRCVRLQAAVWNFLSRCE